MARKTITKTKTETSTFQKPPNISSYKKEKEESKTEKDEAKSEPEDDVKDE